MYTCCTDVTPATFTWDIEHMLLHLLVISNLTSFEIVLTLKCISFLGKDGSQMVPGHDSRADGQGLERHKDYEAITIQLIAHFISNYTLKYLLHVLN
jgi:hypothetical protein